MQQQQHCLNTMCHVKKAIVHFILMPAKACATPAAQYVKRGGPSSSTKNF